MGKVELNNMYWGQGWESRIKQNTLVPSPFYLI